MKWFEKGWYSVLSKIEKSLVWLGGLNLLVGTVMLLTALTPPSLYGYAESTGEIIGYQNLTQGTFSGGSIMCSIRYVTNDGTSQGGLYQATPSLLSQMKTIRIFYKTKNPSEFFVYNPSTLTVGLTIFIFGLGITLAFLSYLKDKSNGINYPD